ncbi:hypothetical protein [Dyella acidisoli]|uniref:Uncharacterized protein n=1 Tax=Dyella acidisoli TaxID=1867834 RepID=A0ABQ5XPA5_9GAMM|nr:hypothetical protein [Dyella acidisoli]GLQ92323.1 hypothetical protein GCM10007901_12740 [Dyella acidisoli]
MFSWLAARSPLLCRRALRLLASRRIRRITPHTLISALPGLGSVLYLHAASKDAPPNASASGLLVAQPAFAPLLNAHWLVAVSVVTDDGPREWCECLDHLGRVRARWHLLPDTDYLAWDALTAPCVPCSITFPSIDMQPLHPDRASVVNFRVREIAGMLLLEQDTYTALSPLGDRIAARIAHAESTVLQS